MQEKHKKSSAFSIPQHIIACEKISNVVLNKVTAVCWNLKISDRNQVMSDLRGSRNLLTLQY